jgi:hypothetical protein
VEQSLSILAEISVGLAGFSSIVVAFRRSSAHAPWSRGDVFRFQDMLESSLVAALLAILPAALRGLGLDEPDLWPFVSALFFVFVVFNTIRRVRQLSRLPAGALSNPLVVFFLIMLAVVAAVQLLNVLGWIVPEGPGPYLFGATWYTIYAGFMFYRLIILPISTQPDPDPPAAF